MIFPENEWFQVTHLKTDFENFKNIIFISLFTTNEKQFFQTEARMPSAFLCYMFTVPTVLF
jgi:hypothetical protein